MRMLVLSAIGAAVLLSACEDKAQKRAQADAKAVNFVPPSVLTRLDFGAQSQRRFRALDRNSDDVLTRDEWPARDSRLQNLDRNHDGRITASEYSEGMMARFDKADLNHDSTVTSDEREALRNGQ